MEESKAKSAEYRANAVACLEKADTMPLSADRSLLIGQALSWLQMARDAERLHRAKAEGK